MYVSMLVFRKATCGNIAVCNPVKINHVYRKKILYKRCVTAFKRGQNLRDLLVRSRLGKAPLDNTTVTGSDSSQDLTTLVNALDEV